METYFASFKKNAVYHIVPAYFFMILCVTKEILLWNMINTEYTIHVYHMYTKP